MGWEFQSATGGGSDRYGSGGKPDAYVLTDGTIGVMRELSAGAKREDADLSHVLLLMDKGHLVPPAFPVSVVACLAELADVKIPSSTA